MPMQAQWGSGGTAQTHPKLGNGWASGPIPKMSPPPGFNPRTFQPKARRCIDYDVLVFIQYRVENIPSNSNKIIWEIKKCVIFSKVSTVQFPYLEILGVSKWEKTKEKGDVG